MLNTLVPYVLALRSRWPKAYQFLVNAGKRFLGKRLGVFPRVLGNEVGAVRAVLRSSQWNMAYGAGLVHERLEAEFVECLGGKGHAIAVNTGGMAIQMSLRAMGMGPGDEVIHQVDTCSATALAIINAGCTPMFCDSYEPTFMLDVGKLRAVTSARTKALLATHMWGNVEQIAEIRRFATEIRVPIIEDCCLALGANSSSDFVGAGGDVAVFSFGCLKPIQGGEGGMIVTKDESLARELRSLRHWGDRSKEYGVRDVTQLAWNGRMSEIVAAVVLEQLRGYPKHLSRLREGAASLQRYLGSINGLSLVLGSGSVGDCTFTQVVLRLDEAAFGWGRDALQEEMCRLGLQARAANFEPINNLSFFAKGLWKKWLPMADAERTGFNFSMGYPAANRIYREIGIGLSNANILSRPNLQHLKKQIDRLARRAK